jgi:hypothetical protein
MRVYVLRDSWNGNIIASYLSKEEAIKQKDKMNEMSTNAKEPKFMGDTKYLQSYYVCELKPAE